MEKISGLLRKIVSAFALLNEIAGHVSMFHTMCILLVEVDCFVIFLHLHLSHMYIVKHNSSCTTF